MSFFIVSIHLSVTIFGYIAQADPDIAALPVGVAHLRYGLTLAHCWNDALIPAVF
jgi:hypothetical protein